MTLDPLLQQYYEQRLSMMGDPAWKDLMEDVESMLKSTNDIASINDEKTLHFRRGEISMMRWLLSLKQVSQESYEGLQNDASI
jgi:hypothetical protein